MTRLAVALLLAMILGTHSPAPAAESPVGQWKTVDEKSGKVRSEIEIYEQGGKLFGKLKSVARPNDSQGNPKLCGKCTGDDKDKPIVGLVIIKNLVPQGDRYSGTIMDPDDGKVYRAEIWVEDGTLKVRGYQGIFYRTQTWPRATGR
jgi:uncharacterized protein (DUF2147 family)